jgi:hypothetical protein
MQTITISTGNPLDKQLKELTGEGWNSHDWDRLVEWEPENDVIRHRKTGLMISILVEIREPEPVQEEEPDIYTKFDQFAIDLRANDRQWREVNAASYSEMLDVLPPLAMSSLGFLGSEPYTHLSTGEGVYISCIESGGQFFAAYLTRKEFRSATLAGIPKLCN